MGGGGGNYIDRAQDKARGYYGKVEEKVQGTKNRLRLGAGGVDDPDTDAAPTMEDIAAREPDKERRRRQRMAALMAQGRQGTILTGSAGMTPNNSVGGGGKQMVGA